MPKNPILRKLTIKSELTKNVLTLMTGTTIAQALPLAITPFLTRLYTPAEFGLLALFMNLTVILSVVATGRYDLALMLPKEDKEAMNVLSLSVVLTLFTSCLVLSIVILFNEPITGLFKTPKFSTWLYLLPLSTLFYGIFQILCSWLNRQKQYVALAGSNVTLKTGTEITKLAVGINKKISTTLSNGLIVGYMFGQFLASTILIIHFLKHEWQKVKLINFKKTLFFAKLYKKFPIYNVPFSLISSFSQGFLVIAFISSGHPEAAGFFGFTKSAMFLPITLLSTSLGRVFFKEATVHFQTPRLEEIAVKLFYGIAKLFTPFIVFIMFWAPEIFGYVFGKPWIEAGKYAAIFAPVVFLFLFTSWPERIFEVAQKQQIPFFIQLISDTIIISTILSLLHWKAKPITCVLIYTLISFLYHTTYIFAVFRVANFHLSTLFSLLKKIIFISILLSSAILFLKFFVGSVLHQFLLSTLILGFYYIILLVKNLK